MKVKICGITSYDDAMLAIDSGADALGFVFYKGSKRYISPEDAALIIAALPPFVEKVALFVNEDASTISQQTMASGATLAQIHFEASQTVLDHLKVPSLRVIRARTAEDVHQYENEYRLVDAFCESYGGSGKRLNLEWFDDVDCSKIILAGGLTPENLQEISAYGFYGVDVSSGVEASAGKKDPLKVRDFIERAKHL